MDINELRKILNDSHAYRVSQLTDGSGLLPFRQILNAASCLVTRLDLLNRQSPLYIFHRCPSDDGAEVEYLNSFERYKSLNTIEDVCEELIAYDLCEVLGSNNFVIWRNRDVDVKRLSIEAVVYEYNDSIEAFHSRGERIAIPSIQNNSTSFFAQATFMDLDEALQRYKEEELRYSSCYILNTLETGIWLDENRILLRRKPESIMRRSLEQYLRRHIRNGEVKPEHNVNETEPVDIKVTWDYSADRALIEIKWLGKCGESTTTYTAARAKDGARQLANYLDEENVRSGKYTNFGYLVVIDARRRGISNETREVSREDGTFYRDKEIQYDPRFHEIRADFKEPIRMFAEPICLPA